MLSLNLTFVAIVFGFASAFCWLRAGKTFTTEEALARVNKRFAKQGKDPITHIGMTYNDGDKEFEPIESGRHQAQWNKWGAINAALSMTAQALKEIVVIGQMP